MSLPYFDLCSLVFLILFVQVCSLGDSIKGESILIHFIYFIVYLLTFISCFGRKGAFSVLIPPHTSPLWGTIDAFVEFVTHKMVTKKSLKYFFNSRSKVERVKMKGKKKGKRPVKIGEELFNDFIFSILICNISVTELNRWIYRKCNKLLLTLLTLVLI